MGGNVFLNTEPFNYDKIPAIQQYLDNILSPLGILTIPIGSTATPTVGKTSGDYDVLIDQTALENVFREKNPKQVRRRLKQVFDQNGATTKLNGIAVHLNVEVSGHHYQVDLLVTPHALQISKFHLHNIPQDSPYKGVNKHLAIMLIANSKGLLWDAFRGLCRRNLEGKRGELITNDIDQVAYLLLGSDSSVSSLDSLESIMKSMSATQAYELLNQLKTLKSWKELS